jgi:hypothetical protein
MDDGTDISPAGTHYYKHIVSVGGWATLVGEA